MKARHVASTAPDLIVTRKMIDDLTAARETALVAVRVAAGRADGDAATARGDYVSACKRWYKAMDAWEEQLRR